MIIIVDEAVILVKYVLRGLSNVVNFGCNSSSQILDQNMSRAFFFGGVVVH